MKETERDVALHVEEIQGDAFKVSGREVFFIYLFLLKICEERDLKCQFHNLK